MTDPVDKHPDLPYTLSCDQALFDMDKVFLWLSVDAYWSKGLPREIFDRSFKNALAFGLFHDQHGQVGVARMVTDKATFAYLADVYIDPNFRGQGLAIWLMQFVMDHPELQGLRRMMLATGDMHALYRKFGFKDANDSKLLMEIIRPNIYANTSE